MQKLNRRSLLLVGFTLFSMFFGAGNLIFPPYLGAQAGADAWLAFVGFAVSAIGLPVIGVIAVARAGGLSELAGRVHPRFAQIFALLVYLSIGPCLAIPRHGEHIVPNARAAHWRRCNAAADLLYRVLCGQRFRCTAPGKADKLARTHSVSDADRTDFRAVFGCLFIRW